MNTAVVIKHPRAAAELVRQTRGPGRLPSTVIRFRDHTYRRWIKAQHDEVIAREVESILRLLATFEEIGEKATSALEWLQRPDLSSDERRAAVQFLEWKGLSFEERNRRLQLGFKEPECPY